MGIEQVVILTHPFEFVQTRDFTLRRLRRHRLNQRRLTQLCQYLDANRARFLPCGIAAAASVPMDSGSAANPLLKGATWRALPRMAGQFAYDRYSKWRLDRQPGREAQPPATGDSEALIQAPGE
jgi:hypothetical protein